MSLDELKKGSCEENGELPNMCPSGKGIEDGEEKSPFDGYMNGNIACVAEGWTTVTLGAFVGSLHKVSIGEALEDNSGDLRRSSRMLSSLLSPSWSLRLLNVELLTSDRLNSSRLGDDRASTLPVLSGSFGEEGLSLSVVV